MDRSHERYFMPKNPVSLIKHPSQLFAADTDAGWAPVGETWNLMKIGYQLKQVRERLAKGLVDKGILRTEKRNFLLFDMATHPVADGGAKDEIRRRVRNVLTNRTVVLPPSQFLPEEMEFRYTRTIAMVCAAYAANVLENALATLGHEARERAFAQVDELLAEYSQWPFGKRAGGGQGVGSNLGQVVAGEVNGSKDRDLQLEVGFFFLFLHFFFSPHAAFPTIKAFFFVPQKSKCDQFSKGRSETHGALIENSIRKNNRSWRPA